jgi:hypothetical protein
MLGSGASATISGVRLDAPEDGAARYGDTVPLLSSSLRFARSVASPSSISGEGALDEGGLDEGVWRCRSGDVADVDTGPALRQGR